MRKKIILLLVFITTLMIGMTFPAVNAAYKKVKLSEKIIMDSGRINMVEWEKLNDSDNQAFTIDSIDPYVSNITGTGDTMIIEPFKALDLTNGDVLLSFDILDGVGQIGGDAYSGHLYAFLEPKENVTTSTALEKIHYPSYFAYMYDGFLVCDTAPAGEHVFYYDEACTKEIEHLADFCSFGLGKGRVTYTYKSNGVLGVTYQTEDGNKYSAFAKNAIPEEYRSGEMCFGLACWGHIQVDNLTLAQNNSLFKTDFEGEWSSSTLDETKCFQINAISYEITEEKEVENTDPTPQATSNTYISSKADGSMLLVEGKTSADLANGDVTVSFDLSNVKLAAADGEYASHLYAFLEPAANLSTTATTQKIAGDHGYSPFYYLHWHEGYLTADYDYEAGVMDFYQDKECTTTFAETAEFCTYTVADGKLTYTFSKDRTLAIESNGVKVYIKDAFPAEFASGEMCFGIAGWGAQHIDNFEVKQNDTVIVSTDFTGDVSEKVLLDQHEAVTEEATPQATSNTYISSKADGSMLLVEGKTSADLANGDVTVSFDLSNVKLAAADGEYASHLYAFLEPAANLSTTATTQKIAGDHGYSPFYYLHWHEGYLTADYDYEAGVMDFYQDKECTTTFAETAEFCTYTVADGKLTYTFSKDRTLAIESNGVKVYIKDAFPAEFASGEMCFGIAGWGAQHIDNFEVKQNDTVIVSTDFTGDVSEKVLLDQYEAVTEEAETEPQVEPKKEVVVVGKAISNKSNTGDMTVVEAFKAADLTNGDVTVSFDLLSHKDAGEENVDYATHLYAFLEPKDNILTSTDLVKVNNPAFYLHYHEGYLTTDYDYQAGVMDFYQDKECTTLYAETAEFCQFALKEGRVSFTFSSDRTLAIESNGVKVYIKDAFPAEFASGEMCFGIAAWGNLVLDNLEFSQYNEVLTCDFEPGWNSLTADDEKVYGSTYKEIKAGGLLVSNPAENQRMVMRNEVIVDENSEYVLDVETAIDFRTLGKKFGFAMGLDKKDSELSTGSFLNFYTGSDSKTHVACGEEDFASELDLTTLGYVTVTLNGLKGGKLKVTVGGEVFNFTNVDFDGYFGIASEGTGELVVAVGKDFVVTNYEFKASEGGEIATNFNTGYVDSDIWTLQNLKAHYLNEPGRDNGIVFEDGVMKFDGVGIMTYFSTKHRYADYILELDYIQPNDLPTTNANGGYLGTFAVCIASNSESGYINSYMFSPFYYADLSFLHFADYSTGVEGTTSNSNVYKFYDPTKTITTAMKFVVVNDTVTVYCQDITEQEFDKDNYVCLGTWNVDGTDGYVCIAGDEGEVQYFDNLRITPIDDKDPQVVQERIANFVDRKPIEDEYATLSAPTVTVNNNKVTWEKVKDAEGYVVTVNGNEQPVQSGLEFTVEGEPGEYKVTVKAVSSMSYVTGGASAASNEVTVKIDGSTPVDPENPTTAPENPTDKPTTDNNPTTQPDSGKKKGCKNSIVSATILLPILALGTCIVIKKRKEE